MITLAEAGDIQPPALVTVNVWVPVDNPVTCVLVTFPVVVPPDDFVSVQVPDGSPERVTVPVGDLQIGCTIAPTTGAAGLAG